MTIIIFAIAIIGLVLLGRLYLKRARKRQQQEHAQQLRLAEGDFKDYKPKKQRKKKEKKLKNRRKFMVDGKPLPPLRVLTPAIEKGLIAGLQKAVETHLQEEQLLCSSNETDERNRAWHAIQNTKEKHGFPTEWTAKKLSFWVNRLASLQCQEFKAEIAYGKARLERATQIKSVNSAYLNLKSKLKAIKLYDLSNMSEELSTTIEIAMRVEDECDIGIDKSKRYEIRTEPPVNQAIVAMVDEWMQRLPAMFALAIETQQKARATGAALESYNNLLELANIPNPEKPTDQDVMPFISTYIDRARATEQAKIETLQEGERLEQLLVRLEELIQSLQTDIATKDWRWSDCDFTTRAKAAAVENLCMHLKSAIPVMKKNLALQNEKSPPWPYCVVEEISPNAPEYLKSMQVQMRKLGFALAQYSTTESKYKCVCNEVSELQFCQSEERYPAPTLESASADSFVEEYGRWQKHKEKINERITSGKENAARLNEQMKERQNQVKSASTELRKIWRTQPHPDTQSLELRATLRGASWMLTN